MTALRCSASRTAINEKWTQWLRWRQRKEMKDWLCHGSHWLMQTFTYTVMVCGIFRVTEQWLAVSCVIRAVVYFGPVVTLSKYYISYHWIWNSSVKNNLFHKLQLCGKFWTDVTVKLPMSAIFWYSLKFNCRQMVLRIWLIHLSTFLSLF